MEGRPARAGEHDRRVAHGERLEAEIADQGRHGIAGQRPVAGEVARSRWKGGKSSRWVRATAASGSAIAPSCARRSGVRRLRAGPRRSRKTRRRRWCAGRRCRGRRSGRPPPPRWARPAPVAPAGVAGLHGLFQQHDAAPTSRAAWCRRTGNPGRRFRLNGQHAQPGVDMVRRGVERVGQQHSRRATRHPWRGRRRQC